MHNEKKDEGKNHDNGSLPLLGLGVAMAIGAAMGLMFAPKSGEEMRKDTADKAMEIAKKFKKTRAEVTAMVEAIFGEVSEELEKNYIEIRGNILAMIDDIKEKGELTRKNYDEAVDKTVRQFSKGKKWSKETVNKLKKSLDDEWKDISK